MNNAPRFYDSTNFSGHFDVAAWLLEHGCPGDRQSLMKRAADKGRVDFMERLLQGGHPWSPDGVLDWAAYRGKFEVLRWARDKGLALNYDACKAAVQRS